MVSSGVANRFWQHGLRFGLSIPTYIISSGMSVVCASAERMNLATMPHLTSNTPSGITTCIEQSAMPTPRLPIPNSRHPISTEYSACFDIFPAGWATSRSPKSSIQCRSACLTTPRIRFSSSWRCINCLTSTIWLSVPAYHDLTPKNQSYEELAQWNGKEMREMSQYWLWVETQSLQGGSPAQSPIFNHSIECTWALLEFHMHAQYKSHNDATLSYMGDALHHSHTFRDVFFLGRASNKAEAKANAPRTELVKKRRVDRETHAETWMPSKMWRKMTTWGEYISTEIHISKQLDANFTIPKIHLISHWVQQIRWYGALQQDSAKRHEHAHKTNLNDSWNTANHNRNNMPQVVTLQRRILCFERRELNLQALAQRRGHSMAACDVLLSGADLPPALRSQSYPKCKCMGPQHCHDWKHLDSMIKTSVQSSTIHKMQRTMWQYTAALKKFIKHESRNMMYISDRQLNAMELFIHHGIELQVEGWDGERISQMCRCTATQS